MMRRAWRAIRPAVSNARRQVRRQRASFVASWRKLRCELQTRRIPRGERTPLAVAASHGETERVERLLREGANPDVQDRYGWTALHHAVVCGQAETAGTLLGRGADGGLHDKRGRTALSLRWTNLDTLHAVRQYFHRLPDPEPIEVTSEVAQAWAKELAQNGILRVSGLIGPNDLAAMQADFTEFAGRIDAKVAAGQNENIDGFTEECWMPEFKYYRSNNPFKWSRELVRLCCNQDLLDAMRLYLGKPAYLVRQQALRYTPELPDASFNYDQFHWHHDADDRRFKLMILLTDVGEDDQYMTYIIGSHNTMHPYRMFLSNNYPPEYARKHLGVSAVFRCTGKAGDIFIFNPNGSHSANRKVAAESRDVFLVSYSADKSGVWGADIDEAMLDGIELDGYNPFERMIAAPKWWDDPSVSLNWKTSLPKVETWL